MKSFNRGRIASAMTLCSAIALTAGCGGSPSGDGGQSQISVASRGPITGFGSVFVGGKRFATEHASFEVDDAPGSESDLRVGMIATVRGYSDDGGHSWHAHKVIYDNEIKGPVSSKSDPDDPRKTLIVLGQTVLINSKTRIYDDEGHNLSFDSLAVGDVLEISGYHGPEGLVATHVERDNDEFEFEIKGRIEKLIGNRFEIRGFPVVFDDLTTDLDGIKAVAEGLYVEVEGQLVTPGEVPTLLAHSIELEDDDFDDAHEVEIEGMITHFDSSSMTFKIGEQRIDAATAELEPATLVLDDGLIVEVEGHIVGDWLVADEIEQRGNEIEIDAPLSAVEAELNRIRFTFIDADYNAVDIVARVSPRTELEDDIRDRDISLAELMPEHFVEFEAFADDSGAINAVEIERTPLGEIKIEAPVEGFDADARRVTLLGIEFDLSHASFENAHGVSITAEAFFKALAPRVFIEIEDANRDGLFEKAKFED